MLLTLRIAKQVRRIIVSICQKATMGVKHPWWLQAVEKVEHSWAFSHLYGKISMGDERCLNEGSWIVES